MRVRESKTSTLATHDPVSILLVDDQPANLLALEAVLEPLGQRTVRAVSGEDALQLLRSEEFATVLLDVHMPGMSGLETFARMREVPETRNIPVIFVSAADGDGAVLRVAYDLGAADYVVKPIDPAVLRAKVSVFVDLAVKHQIIARQATLINAQRLEMAERRTEVRYRSLIDSMPQPTWAARANGEIYYWNRCWEEVTGLSADESANDGYLAAVHPEDRSKLRAAWSEAVAKEWPAQMEVRLRRARDQNWRFYLGRVVPERTPAGAVVGWIATLSDIDDQVRAMAAAETERLKAEAANRAKDEFLATVSHELRTPMTAILGWIRRLSDRSADKATLDKGLNVITRNVEAQVKLIDDLLDVSRIITGNFRLKVEQTSIRDVIFAAVEAARVAAESKGITIETDLEAEGRPIRGDRDRLQQVMWNLLSNAIKFTPKHGRVRIRAIQPSSEIIIEVADNGVGIADDFLPQVFERFRQADGSTTRSHSGLGLGLAIVRHIVELHGGTVRAESAGLGKGATFYVVLPQDPSVNAVVGSGTQPEETRSAPSGCPVAPNRGPGRILAGSKVLMVDDERDVCDLLSLVLEEAGAEVRSAYSVAQAMSEMAGWVPSLVITDIAMPGEDGFTLLERVRSLPPDQGGRTPIVALTGFAQVEQERRVLAAGFARHLAKPVEPDLLVASLQEVALGTQGASS
jgi:PAS domain S-box-containing protein